MARPARRWFAISAHHLVLAGTLCAGSMRPSAADARPPLSLKRIDDGVFVHLGVQEDANADNRGDIANIGFVVGKKCVAVIDTGGSLAVGEDLRAAVRTKTPLPVCYVINTHVHPDHIFGNAAFNEEHPQFVGHHSLPAALASRSSNYLNALQRDLGAAATGSVIVPPTLLVKDELSLDLGGRALRLHAWNTAHTDDDLTVLDEKTGSLWLGDLLFVDRIPVIDGSLLGWLKAIEALRGMHPKHVIPGHGPADAPWQSSLDAQARYLNVLLTEVRAQIRDGRTLQQAVDSVGFVEQKNWLLFDEFHRRNVTTSFTELEWEN